MKSKLLVLLALVFVVFATAIPGAADTVAYYYLVPVTFPYNGTPTGINNAGQVVGVTDVAGVEVGFLYAGGQATIIGFPGAPASTLNSISNSGLMVGDYPNPEFWPHLSAPLGFVYNGTGFSTVQYPGSWSTVAASINSSGEIVGSYALGSPSDPTQYGGYADLNGDFSSIVIAGSGFTEAAAVNDSGEIIGEYADANGDLHGFLDDAGSLTSISYPGECWTALSGINSSGEILGFYTTGCGTGENHYFLWQNGVFTPIYFEDFGPSNAWGLNDSGEFVGNGGYGGGGFIAVPSSVPESSTVIMLALGLITLPWLRRSFLPSVNP